MSIWRIHENISPLARKQYLRADLAVGLVTTLRNPVAREKPKNTSHICRGMAFRCVSDALVMLCKVSLPAWVSWPSGQGRGQKIALRKTPIDTQTTHMAGHGPKLTTDSWSMDYSSHIPFLPSPRVPPPRLPSSICPRIAVWWFAPIPLVLEHRIWDRRFKRKNVFRDCALQDLYVFAQASFFSLSLSLLDKEGRG